MVHDAGEFPSVLLESNVDFVVVGAHAMAVHGAARATGDIDVFVRPAEPNAARTVQALTAFRAPLRSHGVTPDAFAKPGNEVTIEDLSIPFLGRPALLKNQAAAGCPKALADLTLLQESTRKTS